MSVRRANNSSKVSNSSSTTPAGIASGASGASSAATGSGRASSGASTSISTTGAASISGASISAARTASNASTTSGRPGSTSASTGISGSMTGASTAGGSITCSSIASGISGCSAAINCSVTRSSAFCSSVIAFGPIPLNFQIASGSSFICNIRSPTFCRPVSLMTVYTRSATSNWSNGMSKAAAGMPARACAKRSSSWRCSSFRWRMTPRSTRSTNWVSTWYSSGVTGRFSAFLARTASTCGITGTSCSIRSA